MGYFFDGLEGRATIGGNRKPSILAEKNAQNVGRLKSSVFLIHSLPSSLAEKHNSDCLFKNNPLVEQQSKMVCDPFCLKADKVFQTLGPLIRGSESTLKQLATLVLISIMIALLKSVYF